MHVFNERSGKDPTSTKSSGSSIKKLTNYKSLTIPSLYTPPKSTMFSTPHTPYKPLAHLSKQITSTSSASTSLKKYGIGLVFTTK